MPQHFKPAAVVTHVWPHPVAMLVARTAGAGARTVATQQLSPHVTYGLVQTKPQAPSVHAAMPCSGATHDVHEAPHDRAVSRTQCPLHECSPSSQSSGADAFLAGSLAAEASWGAA